jgi:hypothetical protein
MVIAISLIYWWHAGGRETVMQSLRPRFRVMAIDSGAGTMVLRQWNRTYTVKCRPNCQEFAAGRSYFASDRGSDLEIKVAGHVVRCPIVKIEVQFETHPGGLGELRHFGKERLAASKWLKNKAGAYRIRCGVRMATARALLS